MAIRLFAVTYSVASSGDPAVAAVGRVKMNGAKSPDSVVNKKRRSRVTKQVGQGKVVRHPGGGDEMALFVFVGTALLIKLEETTRRVKYGILVEIYQPMCF